MGYPVYGPVAGSLGVPYGLSNGHNVYVTPVHQRPDGMGGYTWTPYPREDFSNNTVNPSQTVSAASFTGIKLSNLFSFQVWCEVESYRAEPFTNEAN